VSVETVTPPARDGRVAWRVLAAFVATVAWIFAWPWIHHHYAWRLPFSLKAYLDLAWSKEAVGYGAYFLAGFMGWAFLRTRRAWPFWGLAWLTVALVRCAAPLAGSMTYSPSPSEWDDLVRNAGFWLEHPEKAPPLPLDMTWSYVARDLVGGAAAALAGLVAWEAACALGRLARAIRQWHLRTRA